MPYFDNCPVIRDLDISIDNAEFMVKWEESSVERTEMGEMNWRLARAEVEEASLSGQTLSPHTLLGLTPRQLHALQGILLNHNQRMNDDAHQYSTEDAELCRNMTAKANTERAEIIASCTPAACALAGLQRASGDQFACGSTSPAAQKRQIKLASRGPGPRLSLRQKLAQD